MSCIIKGISYSLCYIGGLTQEQQTNKQWITMGQEDGEKRLKSRKKDVSAYLSAQQCSGDLAMRLHSKGVIAKGPYQEVNNFGPRVTEAYKIGVILDAVIAVCAVNPTRITTFTQVLRDMGHGDIADLIDSKLESCVSC